MDRSNNGPIFAIYGQKKTELGLFFSQFLDQSWMFTNFGTHVREWSQFATPFSDRRYLVPVPRYLQ